VQGVGFIEFLAQTQKTLAAHKRLLPLTVFLILVLGVALAAIVYRGMISPLRASLSQSERIIERQEKLASLGILASGVAHEIRNPLTAIKFRLFSLKKAVPALNTSNDAVVVEKEINRLDSIVKDFLRFARPSEPELRPVHVGPLITELHRLMSAQLNRAGITLQLKLTPGAIVQADPDQLKQVLINLIQNAAEAIQREGVITVETRIKEEDLAGENQPALVVSVEDTGKGIPPEVEARLFDPFFSTKEGGTGLGLAISARIVEKHHGILRYQTQLNRGTLFEIVMPVFEHEHADVVVDRG
jgi:signal transduction histidine kinase